MAKNECTCSAQDDAANAERLRSLLHDLSRTQEACQLLINLSSFVDPGDQEAYFTMLDLLSNSLKDGIKSCLVNLSA
ncbi:hypothetical protein X963_5662 [Burkholderia pseudomallei MSHR7498]|uniref:STAS domain-containing protein n=1 Tax=Burkholderia pseudomallei TaxID=28450 RepID=UPI000531A8CC|nr:STAS domain-containing protein [Burkholderia pseudomallei]KGS84680.1 hypothetical protein X942_2583 [Burkholderia pseudomallei MSHR5596]KGS91858.1 hypothetical protein X963_5662 [Burkholderia pseudomallei MSHR7498]